MVFYPKKNTGTYIPGEAKSDSFQLKNPYGADVSIPVSVSFCYSPMYARRDYVSSSYILYSSPSMSESAGTSTVPGDNVSFNTTKCFFYNPTSSSIIFPTLRRLLFIFEKDNTSIGAECKVTITGQDENDDTISEVLTVQGGSSNNPFLLKTLVSTKEYVKINSIKFGSQLVISKGVSSNASLTIKAEEYSAFQMYSYKSSTANSVIIPNDIVFSQTCPFYVGGARPYIQFDVMRCIEFYSFNGNVVKSGGGSLITIEGQDDRGVAVKETLTMAGNNTCLDKETKKNLVSNKAYYRVNSISLSSSLEIEKGSVNQAGFSIQASNQYFGSPYFLSRIASVSSSLRSVCGLNFRAKGPNATESSYANSKGPSITNAQRDARGILYTENDVLSSDFDTLLISALIDVPGLDSNLDAAISGRLGLNDLTKKAYQRAISEQEPNPSSTKTQSAPTKLTKFDLYGAQYPGDMDEYNKTFADYSKLKMA